MATLMLIAGMALTALSGVVSAIMLAILVRAQLRVRAHGIDELMPTERGVALILGGWTVSIIVSVLLIVQP